MLPSLIATENLDLLCQLAASSPPGCIVELGVYQGGSAQRLYEVCERQNRQLHLFDTFAGHPVVTMFDDSTQHYSGRYGDAIDPRELSLLMPNAFVHVGEFPASLIGDPINDVFGIAFIHSDMDLYAPTRAVCEVMPERMVEGGRIYFDDYGVPECPGVNKAVDELLPDGRILSNGKYLWTKR